MKYSRTLINTKIKEYNKLCNIVNTLNLDITHTSNDYIFDKITNLAADIQIMIDCNKAVAE